MDWPLSYCSMPHKKNLHDISPGDCWGVSKHDFDQYVNCWKQLGPYESGDVLYLSDAYEKLFGGVLVSISLSGTDKF